MGVGLRLSVKEATKLVNLWLDENKVVYEIAISGQANKYAYTTDYKGMHELALSTGRGKIAREKDIEEYLEEFIISDSYVNDPYIFAHSEMFIIVKRDGCKNGN